MSLRIVCAISVAHSKVQSGGCVVDNIQSIHINDNTKSSNYTKHQRPTKMSMPKVPTAYPDCAAFAEQCVDDSIGARRPFKTEGEAVQFRKRMNFFRELERKQNARIYSPDDKRHGTSDYDLIQFTIKESEDGWWWVYGRRLKEGTEDIERLSDIEGASDDHQEAS